MKNSGTITADGTDGPQLHWWAGNGSTINNDEDSEGTLWQNQSKAIKSLPVEEQAEEIKNIRQENRTLRDRALEEKIHSESNDQAARNMKSAAEERIRKSEEGRLDLLERELERANEKAEEEMEEMEAFEEIASIVVVMGTVQGSVDSLQEEERKEEAKEKEKEKEKVAGFVEKWDT